MELFDVVHDLACEKRSYERKSCGCPAARPRKVSQRVEVEMIDNFVEGILQRLSVSKSCLVQESKENVPQEAEQQRC